MKTTQGSDQSTVEVKRRSEINIPSENLLQIDDFLSLACVKGKWNQSVREMGLDRMRDELFEGIGIEFVASNLTLGRPEVSVDVEDAMAEELVEDRAETGSLDVVGEVGAEEVVDDGGVGGADAVGEVDDSVDLDG